MTEPPRGMREELARLEAEAGIEDNIDPPAPPGNLKDEIETFGGLDRCVRAHTLRDPLLGDAMDALGYDTLTRDACRVLAALSAKSSEPCKPIVASPLRHRCESYVAVFTENPKACPTLEGTSTLGARDPSCLARAAKDERLCAAASPPDRATCRALVRGQIKECGSDEACVHQVERWKALFAKPAENPPFAIRLRARVTPEGSETQAIDMNEVAAGGVALRLTTDRAKLSLGVPRSAAWSSWDSPLASPRLFLELTLPRRGLDKIKSVVASSDAGAAFQLGPLDLKLDLVVPKVAELSALTASELTLTVTRWTTEPRGELALTLTGKLRDAPRVFDVRLEIETFVRDVVGGP